MNPIGEVLVGPLHTLHRHDGSLAKETIWYNDSYADAQVKPFKPRQGWEILERRRKFVQRRLSRLPYGADLSALFTRYALALDHTDKDVAFLKMWSMLERITLTSEYDETIKRAVWVVHAEEREVAKERLQYMRYRRNQYVHASKSHGSDDEADCRPTPSGFRIGPLDAEIPQTNQSTHASGRSR